MSKFGKDLTQSLTAACGHAEGKPSRVRIETVEVPDMRVSRAGAGCGLPVGNCQAPARNT